MRFNLQNLADTNKRIELRPPEGDAEFFDVDGLGGAIIKDPVTGIVYLCLAPQPVDECEPSSLLLSPNGETVTALPAEGAYIGISLDGSDVRVVRVTESWLDPEETTNARLLLMALTSYGTEFDPPIGTQINKGFFLQGVNPYDGTFTGEPLTLNGGNVDQGFISKPMTITLHDVQGEAGLNLLTSNGLPDLTTIHTCTEVQREGQYQRLTVNPALESMLLSRIDGVRQDTLDTEGVQTWKGEREYPSAAPYAERFSPDGLMLVQYRIDFDQMADSDWYSFRVYRSSNPSSPGWFMEGDYSIVSIDHDGKEPRGVDYVSVSPDGNMIAVVARDQAQHSVHLYLKQPNGSFKQTSSWKESTAVGTVNFAPNSECVMYNISGTTDDTINFREIIDGIEGDVYSRSGDWLDPTAQGSRPANFLRGTPYWLSATEVLYCRPWGISHVTLDHDAKTAVGKLLTTYPLWDDLDRTPSFDGFTMTHNNTKLLAVATTRNADIGAPGAPAKKSIFYAQYDKSSKELSLPAKDTWDALVVYLPFSLITPIHKHPTNDYRTVLLSVDPKDYTQWVMVNGFNNLEIVFPGTSPAGA